MYKQIVGENIIFIYKGWNTNTYYSVDKPQNHYAKWKKPDTKGHVLYESTYMKYPEQVNS